MKSRLVRYYPAAFVALITLAVYLPALRNGFVIWDDEQFIIDNYHIRTLNWAFFRWALNDLSFSIWQPAAWISHAIDYALWGLNPMGHHLSSIVLHSLNTFLVVMLIIRLLEAAAATNSSSLSTGGADREPLAKSGSPGRASFTLDRKAILIAAATTGLLFGLHPLHVESTVWITGRTDLIATFFSLLSIIAYISFAAMPRPGAGGIAWKSSFLNKNYVMAFVFFILALTAKPAAVSLPMVLLLLDWYPFQRLATKRDIAWSAGEKIPFIAVSAAITALTLLAFRNLGIAGALLKTPLSDRVLVAFKSVLTYLWKMIAPFDLLPLYPLPEKVELLSIEYITPVVMFCLIIGVCLMTLRRQRVVTAAWLYYLVVLLPVLDVGGARVSIMADRYTYFSSLGPFFLAGVASAWFWRKKEFFKGARWLARRLSVVVAIAVVTFLSYLTVKQIAIWKDSIALWSYVIEKEPNRVPMAYNNRGLAYLDMGQFDRAIDDCTSAIAIDNAYYLAYYNRGKAFKETGQLERAMDDYNAAIALNRSYPNVYTARGMLYAEVGQLSSAVEDFTRALTLDPELHEVYIVRGMALKELGRFDLAIEDYTRAIAINPSVEAFNNRGVAFKYQGRLDLAIKDYTQALELDPSFYLAYCNRGVVFAMTDDIDRAIEDYTKALSLKPDLIRAYLERGNLYRGSGNRALATIDYQKACDLGSREGCDALRLNSER